MIFYYLDKLLLSIYPHFNNYNKNLYIFLIGIVLYISLFYLIDMLIIIYIYIYIYYKMGVLIEKRCNILPLKNKSNCNNIYHHNNT